LRLVWPITAVTVFAVGILFVLNDVSAQTTLSSRTYVSRLGKDSNTCTSAAPCRTLQAALAKTAAGGQIYALNSADYGYVTINMAVSIISGRGATGVLANSSVSGITINAGPDDIVNLQGLDIDGAGSGVAGVLFSSGAALRIQDSNVRGFTSGISFQPNAASTLVVEKTVISNNNTGIAFQISTASTGALNNVQLVNNGTGLAAIGSGSSAVASVTVKGSLVSNNTTAGILAGAYSAVIVADSTFANNGVGLSAQSANASIQMSGTTVSGNAIAWQVASAGQVITAGGNSFGGNIAGDSAPPSAPVPVTSDPPPPLSSIAKNIVTDFGAVCNGSADDAPAFMSFSSWAKTQSLPITLTVPSGRICNFASTPNAFAVGIKSLTVSGYGAKFTTTQGSFFLGGIGISPTDPVRGSRTATAQAGQTSVTLSNVSESSRFIVGKWAVLTGFDLQGYGYPVNHAFFEYVKIAAVDSTKGQVTFTAPLINSYNSSWPHYVDPNTLDDMGGPATLYTVDTSWDADIEYKGLTITGGVQTYANGRNIRFTDVTFDGCNGSSGGGIAPTQNLAITLTNVTMNCAVEVDKLVSNFTIEGGIFDQLYFASSSGGALFRMNNGAVNVLNGTPQKTVIANSTIGTFIAGTLNFGRSTEISCTTCRIGSFKNPAGGSLDNKVDSKYSMSNGIIAIPKSHGPAAWAVPGVNAMFARFTGGVLTSGVPFQVVDVTQDSTNIYVATSLPAGFPPLPTDPNNGLSIYVHPAPKFTCSNCTGGADAVDLSQAPPGAPLFSYSKRTYDGSKQVSPLITIWGSLVQFSVNVTKAYSGTQSQLVLRPFGDGGAAIVSNGVAQGYNPQINLKVAGERDVFPNSINGAQPGDNISIPGTIWIQNTVFPWMSADLSAEPSSVWPTFTIEIKTDHGLFGEP
jgi:hypothetical protein